MAVVLLLLVVLCVGLAAALVVGRLGDSVEGLEPPTSTLSHVPLPPGPVRADQVAALAFDRAIRGYRMDQVDDVLDRLAAELRERDERLAELTQPTQPTQPTQRH